MRKKDLKKDKKAPKNPKVQKVQKVPQARISYAQLEKVAQEVLRDIKSGTATRPPVVSSHDIIPRPSLPYNWTDERDLNCSRFGSNKMLKYERHNRNMEKVRAAVIDLMGEKEEKVAYPQAIENIAVTLCGYGECGETSMRAVLDLILAFNAKKYDIPIIAVIALGKRRERLLKLKDPSVSDQAEGNFYHHAFLIIGHYPHDFMDKNFRLSELRRLSEDCVLLDPSLGVIGKANQTEVLLKDMFAAYEMDRLGEAPQYFSPFLQGPFSLLIYHNAEKISRDVMTKLSGQLEPEPPVLLKDQIRLFDCKRTSRELLEQIDGTEEFVNSMASI